MRTTKILVSVLSVFLSATMCSKKGGDVVSPDTENGMVQFSLSCREAGAAKTLAPDTSRLGDIHSVYIRIQSLLAGEEQPGFEDVREVYREDGSFFIEPIELIAGSYTLDTFVLLDAEDTALYGLPAEGSASARYVDDPAPVMFSIYANDTTELAPEVVPLFRVNPGDLGYVSLPFVVRDVSQNELRVQVSAVVDSIDSHGTDVLDGRVLVGDTIKGYYRYHLDAADEEDSEGFSHFMFFSGPYGFFLQCDTLRFETDTSSPLVWIDRVNNHAASGYEVEAFYFNSTSNRLLAAQLYVNDIRLELEGGRNIPLTNPAWLRKGVPSLSDWEDARLCIYGSSCIDGEHEMCHDHFRIVARITSLSED